MLRLWVLLLFLLQVQGDTDNERVTIDEIESIIQKRCLTHADQVAYDRLWEGIFNYHFCTMQNRRLLPADEDISKSICTKVREGSYICLKNFLDMLEPCLASDEKFLLDFVLQVHNTSFEQECREDVISMHERKLALHSAQCDPPVTDMQNKLVQQCFPKVVLIQKLRNADYILKKEDLCSNIETAKKCATEEAETRCPNDDGVAKFVTDYFDSYLYWCKEDK